MPKIIDVTIARHSTITITAEDIDFKLSNASGAMQTKNANLPGEVLDVDCPVKFKRLGGVAVFSALEFRDIDDGIEYFALRDTPALAGIRVKLVSRLFWCKNLSGNYTGCADQPGNHLVLDRDWGGLDLAHEFGHNKGIAGVTGAQNILRLMTDTPTGASPNVVTAAECRAFQN